MRMNNEKRNAAHEAQDQELHEKKPRIEIREENGKAIVFLNDADITSSLYAYEVEHEVGCLPKLKLSFANMNMAFASDFIPQLPEPWCDYYEIVLKDSGNSSVKEQV